MIPPASTGTPPHFTYDQIVYFARLVQQIRGTTLRFVATDDNEVQEETIPLPNDIRLVQAFQRLQGEAVNPGVSERKVSTVHLQVAGMDVYITRSHEVEPALPGNAFAVTIAPCHKEAVASENKDVSQKPEEEENPYEYCVFDDYETSFVWAASTDGLRAEVLDDNLPSTFTPTLADDLRKWTDAYDSNFRLQGCDQGSGLDVFPTVSDIVTWTIEGAVLSTRMAVVTSIPVVYSAYLRQGNAYQFVGDALKDAATLVTLVLRLNKYLTIVRPADSQVDGILRLKTD